MRIGNANLGEFIVYSFRLENCCSSQGAMDYSLSG
jgi:hypothetical protein